MSRVKIEPIGRGRSLAQQAYSEIRRAIRDGALVHDEIYSEKELGESLEISRTPVREALIELAREGMVEILQQRGFRLRELSDREIAEVFDLREVLEEYAIGKLAARATDEDVEQLSSLVAQQSKAKDTVLFLSLDEQFHLLIPRLVELERTYEMSVNLRAVMWLVANVAISAASRISEVVEEHQAIVDAVARHSPKDARRASQAHLKNTRAALAARKGGSSGSTKK